MRIAIFTEYINKNGGGSQIATLHYALGLKNLRHEAQIYYVKNTYADSLLSKLKINHFALSPFLTPLISFDVFGALKSLKEFKPNLIVVNEVFSTFVIGLLCGWMLGIPVVACFHTYYFKNSETSIAWINEVIRVLNILYIRPMFNLVDGVTVASKTSRDFLQTQVHIPSKKIVLIPYPVYGENELDVTYTKLDSRTNNIRFLYAGRLVKGKNVDLLVKTFANLKNTNWSLTIIGSGREEKNIQKLITKLKLEQKITLKPFMPREDLMKEFINYDVFISLSDMETFGYTYFEPLIYGLKLVCLEYDTTKEFFEHFVSAQLLKSMDPKTLAQQLDKLMSDPEFLNTKQADLAFLQTYTYNNAALKFIEAYEKI